MTSTAPDLNPDSLNLYVISDGRLGIENQALGLAESLARHIANIRPAKIDTFQISHKALFKAASPRAQFAMKPRPQDYGLPLHSPNKHKAPDKHKHTHAPHIAIGCGRQAIAPLLALKKARPNVMSVYVQDPRIDPQNFDLVIVPEHDGLKASNVETMIGSPNRVTDEKIIGETLSFSDGLLAYPAPRGAMLIGGTSKSHKYSREDLSAHIKAAQNLLTGGMSVLITTSRRTPDFALQAFRDPANGANPYFAFLGGADIILVTQDSTNMLTEACATGKPVFSLPMSGKAGKFEQLYSCLAARCHVAPYIRQLTGPDYAPLDETARITAKLWTRYQVFSHAK